MKIVGDRGTLEAESYMPGIAGFMPDLTIKMYMWQSSDGSAISVTFENNKLNMKTQFGLK